MTHPTVVAATLILTVVSATLTMPLEALANGNHPPAALKKVTLWNSGTCPYAQRAWIALKEKGIDGTILDYQMVDLQNKDATPEFGIAYYKANPNTMSSSKVPVMVVETEVSATESGDGNDDQRKDNSNKRYYTESKVVLEVIEELFPEGPRLLSDDIDQRYRARVFGDAVYDSIWGGDRSPYKMLGRKLKNDANDGSWDPIKEEETLRCMLEHLNESLQSLDAIGRSTSTTSTSGPFVCGEHFGMAECVTAPFVQRADFVLSDYLGMNVLQLCQTHGYERAGAWWKAVLERPSVKETASPDPRASIQRVIDMMMSKAPVVSR